MPGDPQGERTAWRQLLLLVKAKFVAVEMGVASFEHEFLSHTMLPDGSTMRLRTNRIS